MPSNQDETASLIKKTDSNTEAITESIEAVSEQSNTITYHAPKPKTPAKTLARRIAVRCLFPPILLWDATKLLANHFGGEAVGRIVLPAQTEAVYDQYAFDAQVQAINRSDDLIVEKHNVVTHDGAQLDTLEINNNKNQGLANEKQYIVNFVGNGMCYENILEDMESDARELGCNVIGFNLRGVQQSTGKPKSKDDLVTDGIAQVQRLLDAGADPENITLKGHSLGAGVATLVADHFHRHGQKINLFNGRSFSTITNFVVGQIRTADTDYKHNGHQETFGKKLLGYLAKPFIKFGVALVKWEIDAASAYKRLPDTHKEYMVVRSSKKRRTELGYRLKDDPVIPHYTSLHRSLTRERRKHKAEIDNTIKSIVTTSTYALVNENMMKAVNNLKDARKQLKTRKMVADHEADNGHQSEMSSLKDRYSNKSANNHFRSFFKRVHAHHVMEKEAVNQRQNQLLRS